MDGTITIAWMLVVVGITCVLASYFAARMRETHRALEKVAQALDALGEANRHTTEGGRATASAVRTLSETIEVLITTQKQLTVTMLGTGASCPDEPDTSTIEQ